MFLYYSYLNELTFRCMFKVWHNSLLENPLGPEELLRKFSILFQFSGNKRSSVYIHAHSV